MATKKTEATAERIAIKAPDMRILAFNVRGVSPLVQHRFWKKAEYMAGQEEGSTTRSKKKRPPRKYEEEFMASMHRSTDGWVGVPASAFRKACIDVCRMVGFKMTFAKMSIFIDGDGFDSDDGQPLVKLKGKDPERLDMAVRNANGSVDIRARPMWREWSIDLRVRYDADQFTATDVANLLERAGQQVGIGEGRPFSKNSAGMGYGTFTVRG